MKRNLLTIVAGGLLAVIFVLWLFSFQVRTSEVALVTTFGNPTRVITNAGWNSKLPWPIQRVHKFDRRIQNFEDKFDETRTAEGNNLLSLMYVGWQITDASAFYPRFGSGSISESERASIAKAEQSIEGIVRSTKIDVIGKHVLADFVSTDPGQLKIEAIESEILASVASQLRTNNYGLEIKFLAFKKLGLPAPVTEEIFKQMTSERNVLISKINYDGQQEAAKIQTTANSESAIILAKAAAEATQIIGEGKAAAAKSFETFRQNPELQNFLLDLDSLDGLMKSKPTLILDDRSSPFNLFKGVSTNLSPRK